MPIPLCLLHTRPSAAARLTALEWCSCFIFVLFRCLGCKLCECLCKGSADLSMSCLQSPGCLCSVVLLFIACLRQLTKYLHTFTSAALCMREASCKQPHPFCSFLSSLLKNVISCCASTASPVTCHLTPKGKLMGLYLRTDQMLCFLSLFLLPVGAEALRWVTSTASSCVKKSQFS